MDGITRMIVGLRTCPCASCKFTRRYLREIAPVRSKFLEDVLLRLEGRRNRPRRESTRDPGQVAVVGRNSQGARMDSPRAEGGGVNAILQTLAVRGWDEYERRKQEWIRAHPEATPVEYTAAMLRIAAECGV